MIAKDDIKTMAVLKANLGSINDPRQRVWDWSKIERAHSNLVALMKRNSFYARPPWPAPAMAVLRKTANNRAANDVT